MTEENRRINITLEWSRVLSALRAARLLLDAGEYADAISRAYYAMLHAARAVILVDGLEANTHGGVAHYLNLHFVRQERFPLRQSRALSQIMAERQAADYDRTALFDQASAEQIVMTASEFTTACLQVLDRERYSPTEH